jgi:hypothetical protein
VGTEILAFMVVHVDLLQMTTQLKCQLIVGKTRAFGGLSLCCWALASIDFKHRVYLDSEGLALK